MKIIIGFFIACLIGLITLLLYLLNETNSNITILVVLLVLIILDSIFIYLIYTQKMTFPFLYYAQFGGHYTIATIQNKSPLLIDTAKLEIIDWKNHDFNPPLRFMADPFVVEEKGIYYIFFEQLNFKLNAFRADIAVLQSTDLKEWKYLGIALHERFHMSYPYTFKFEGKWYMIPETVAVGSVRLYESENFPFNWIHKKNLLNFPLADSTLIIKDDVIYLMGMSENDDALRLYFADSLFTEFKEHKCSPIRVGEQNETRPAGKPLEIDGKIIYFVQDHSYTYGSGVIAYQIDLLTKTEFKDSRLAENPILFRFGDDWAHNGMHHLSHIKIKNNQYFCVMDGLGQDHTKGWKFSWRNFPEFQ